MWRVGVEGAGGIGWLRAGLTLHSPVTSGCRRSTLTATGRYFGSVNVAGREEESFASVVPAQSERVVVDDGSSQAAAGASGTEGY